MSLETERAAFLTAILNQPDDDTHRLVYADWLQEQDNENDRQQAEFIRLQCEIATWEDKITADVRKRAKNLLRRVRSGAPVSLKANTPATKLAREHMLLHGPKWAAGTSVLPSQNFVRWFMDDLVLTNRFGPNYRRGFVSILDCLSVDALTLDRDQLFSIFACHPISSVSVPGLRVEIDQPGVDHNWQAYYYHGNEADYCSMNGWETRVEMVVGVMADMEHLVAEFA